MNFRTWVVACLLVARAATAFVPQNPLHDNIQGSFEAILKKASAKTNLKSSKAEPRTDLIQEDLTAPAKISTTTKIMRHANKHKRWGVDNQQENEYWLDSRIHTLGNCGFWGGVHAALAPISTKMIDNIAYQGVDIRRMVNCCIRLLYCVFDSFCNRGYGLSVPKFISYFVVDFFCCHQ